MNPDYFVLYTKKGAPIHEGFTLLLKIPRGKTTLNHHQTIENPDNSIYKDSCALLITKKTIDNEKSDIMW